MKVLLVHNFYRQAGGEDEVFRAECAALREAGHEVVTYERSNAEIAGGTARDTAPASQGAASGASAAEPASQGARPPTARGAERLAPGAALSTALGTIWSHKSAAELRAIIQRETPDVAHFHNTFPLISPSAYYACVDEKVPVVQTLHNYRLLCPSAVLFRDGHVCEDCLGKALAWPGIAHGCYRDSRSATAAAAAMLAVHRMRGTWTKVVHTHIALTEFAKHKFIEGGLPAERIAVKPNFLVSPPSPCSSVGDYALFMGRLAPEKGVPTLLRAWEGLEIPLKIVGSGPLAEEVATWVGNQGQAEVELLDWMPRERLFEVLREARFVVFPSEWYEGFGMTLVETFACGVPVVASRIGAIADIVQHGSTGLLFEPGDAQDLASQADLLWQDVARAALLGANARREFEAKYTAEENLKMLLQIYEDAGAG